MAIFSKYTRLAASTLARFIDLNQNQIVENQLYDSSTLARKTSKQFEAYCNGSYLYGGFSGPQPFNFDTKAYSFGSKAGEGIYAKTYLKDNNSNSVYFFGNAGIAIHEYDFTLNKDLTNNVNVGINMPGGYIFVGQDSTNVYGFGMQDRGHGNAGFTRFNKASKVLNVAGYISGDAATYCSSFKIMNATDMDNSAGRVAVFISKDGATRRINTAKFSQGWTSIETTLSAVTTAATVNAQVFPTDANASNEFWAFCPKAGSADLGLHYYKANSNWTAMLSNGVLATINFNGFTGTGVTGNAYGVNFPTNYENFLLPNKKILVTRTLDCGSDVIGSALTANNQWWVFDVTNPTAPVLLNTSGFTNAPYLTSRMQKAPDGRYYAYVQNVGVQFFTFDNTTNSLVNSTLVNTPSIRCMTFDSTGRLWWISTDDTLYFEDNATTLDVELILGTPTQTYSGIDMSNTLSVSAKNYTGTLVVSKISLLCTEGAVFTSNGLTTIQITTSATSSISVPITVKSAGQISFTAKPVF